MINVLVKLFCYGLFFFGIWIMFSPYIYFFFVDKLLVIRSKVTSQEEKGYIRHLRLLLSTTLKKGESAIFGFIFLCLAIFIISLTVLIKMINFNIYVLIMAVLIGITPYVFLRIRLLGNRVEGSYEGERLIAELTNQYKINDKNMVEAIDKTIPFIADCPYSKKALFFLSLKIKTRRKSDDLKQAIEEFVYFTATEWAKLLSLNIYLAVEDGIDVTQALHDLQEQLKEAKEALEADLRYNNEAFVMVRNIIPLAYLFSIFAAVKWFDFSVKKFFEYQLGTSLGIKMGLIIYLLIIINSILVGILKKPKFDVEV